MTSVTLPAASYGRNNECPETAVDQYQILFQSNSFPASARTALEQLAASVQWAGGGAQEKYADCHALWPVSGEPRGFLIARLIDAGRDRLGRPHALRIDVVFVEAAELIVSADEVASLLNVDAWPSLPWEGTLDGIQLNTGLRDSAVPIALNQVDSDGRSFPKVFVARHLHFRASGFDLVFDPNAPSGRVAVNSIANSQVTIERASTCFDAAPLPRRTASPIWIALLLVTLLGGGVAGWWGYGRYQHLAVDWSRLQRELHETKVTLDREALAHHKITALMEGFQRKLETEESQEDRNAALLSELNDLLQDFNLMDMSELRASLQSVEDSKQHNPDLAYLESIRKADNAVDRCLKEMERAIDSLRKTKNILDQYRTQGPQH